MERNRAVVSEVPAFARRRSSPQECPRGIDRDSVRAEDGHRLERPAHRSLRLFVQDLLATHSPVVGDRPLAADARAAAGPVAWRRAARLVESSRRLLVGESSTGWTKTGPNPTDRGRSGSKHCLLTDAGGVPLVVQTAPANQHDVKTLLPLVVEIPAVAGKAGRRKQKPDSLLADKAFDCEALRQLLRWLGIEPHLPHRGDDEHGLGVLRWFVERTISWL